MEEMIQDQRPIKSVDWFDRQEAYSVGHGGVTKIEAYGEPSHYCARPFIAVWKGEFLWKRLDAAGVEVEYSEGRS
jgi:hypothetical protein